MRADRSAVRAARSAARAERFPERTDAKVATASTRVPAAVASEATVAHSISVTRRSLAQPALTPRTRETSPIATFPGRRGDLWPWRGTSGPW